MDFDEHSQLYRVVTLGESSVGKSSIINRLGHNAFNPIEQPTIGATFLLHSEESDRGKIEMQIWDTAGQEKYRSLSPIYCRGAAAAIIVFDVTNRDSFAKLDQWTTLVTETSGVDTAIVSAANKCDLAEKAKVSDDEMNGWAQAAAFKLIRTSAKTGDGIEDLVHEVAIGIASGRAFVGGSSGVGGLKKNSEAREGCC
jgi:small GTP-binding protein